MNGCEILKFLKNNNNNNKTHFSIDQLIKTTTTTKHCIKEGVNYSTRESDGEGQQVLTIIQLIKPIESLNQTNKNFFISHL